MTPSTMPHPRYPHLPSVDTARRATRSAAWLLWLHVAVGLACLGLAVLNMTQSNWATAVFQLVLAGGQVVLIRLARRTIQRRQATLDAILLMEAHEARMRELDRWRLPIPPTTGRPGQ
jgi:hypothetical protein